MKAVIKAVVLVSGVALAMAAHAQVIDQGERGKLSPTGLISTAAIIDKDGKVVVWGYRELGQQGNGVKVVAATDPPARVNSLSNINYLATGSYHLLALDSLRNVYGWGWNTNGETGCSTSTQPVNTPCRILTGVDQIAAGEYFSMARTAAGQVYTWGKNEAGQLGNGTTTKSHTPVQVNLNGERARIIGAATRGGFAVTLNGHVWAWGENEASGLGFQGPGFGTSAPVLTPTRVPNLEPYAANIKYIGGGQGWGEALLYDGRVIGWGLRSAIGVGKFHDVTTESSPVPIQIMDGVETLFARYDGSVAIAVKRDLEDNIIGKYVYTWGLSTLAPTPNTTLSPFGLRMIYGEAPKLHYMTNQPTAVGGGRQFTLYQTSDGKIWGVGYNHQNKLDMTTVTGSNIHWPGIEINL
ncbi:MAG: hypothetical protein LBV45_04340 [Xanthomonadaceae bacterium]|jgi:alpha-tubulin suppressor-like RCC1 family protein|nr:hypothetical protein [Xanthomonadaceae bacterium]